MKQKNYTKFSEKSENKEVVPAEELNPLTVETVAEEVNEVVPETVEPKELPEPTIGVVVNCEKLNVRADASKDSKVLQVINKNDEVEIVLTFEDFYRVITASGVDGFCMSKYIKIK